MHNITKINQGTPTLDPTWSVSVKHNITKINQGTPT